jgi:hypothetical protein
MKTSFLQEARTQQQVPGGALQAERAYAADLQEKAPALPPEEKTLPVAAQSLVIPLIFHQKHPQNLCPKHNQNTGNKPVGRSKTGDTVKPEKGMFFHKQVHDQQRNQTAVKQFQKKALIFF